MYRKFEYKIEIIQTISVIQEVQLVGHAHHQHRAPSTREELAFRLDRSIERPS